MSEITEQAHAEYVAMAMATVQMYQEELEFRDQALDLLRCYVIADEGQRIIDRALTPRSYRA